MYIFLSCSITAQIYLFSKIIHFYGRKDVSAVGSFVDVQLSPECSLKVRLQSMTVFAEPDQWENITHVCGFDGKIHSKSTVNRSWPKTVYRQI